MAEDETGGLPCVECDLKATYYCVDCDNFYFCTLCFNKIHSFNIFKRHVKQPIELSPCKQTPVKEKTLKDEEQLIVPKKTADEEKKVSQNKSGDEKTVERKGKPEDIETKVRHSSNVKRVKEQNNSRQDEVQKSVSAEEKNEQALNDREYEEGRVDEQNKLKHDDDVKVLINSPGQNNAMCEEVNISLNILCEEAAKRQAESKYGERNAKKKLFTEDEQAKQKNTNVGQASNAESGSGQNKPECVEDLVNYQPCSVEIEIQPDMSQCDEELVIGWQSYNDERINEEMKYSCEETVISQKISKDPCAIDKNKMLKQEGSVFLNMLHEEEAEKMRMKPKYTEVRVKRKPYSQVNKTGRNRSKISVEVKSAKQQYEELMEEMKEEKQTNSSLEKKERAKRKIIPKNEEIILQERPLGRRRRDDSKSELAAIFGIQKYNDVAVNKNNAETENADKNPYIEDVGKEQYVRKAIREEVTVISSQSNEEDSVEIISELESKRENITEYVSSEEQDEWRYTMKDEELAILEKHINSQIILNRNRLKNVSAEEYVEMLKKEEVSKGRRVNGDEGGLFVHVPNTYRDTRQKRKLELRVVLEKLPHDEERVYGKKRPNKAEFIQTNEVPSNTKKNLKQNVIKQEKKYSVSKGEDVTKNAKSTNFEMTALTYKYTPRTYTRTRRSKRKLKKRLTLQSKPKLKSADNLKKCATCEKSFKHKGDLVKHIRIHTGERPYKCEYCNKAFLQRSHLVIHERIHTGVRPHVCVYCKSTFTQKTHMTEHVRSHTGERPYPCAFCEKRFMKKSHLDEHTRIHTGYKPYQCPYCEKCFCLSVNYKNHMKIHTGETAYKCTVCPKRFNLRTDLVRHNRKHTGEKPFKCGVCKFPFSLKANLKKHVKNQHTILEINQIMANL